MDRILIDMGHHPSLLDVQSFRGAHCYINHYLIVAKVRERLSLSKWVQQKVLYREIQSQEAKQCGR
jgi:hypothetical protein